MLIQFAVENFLSFQGKIVFSLRALDSAPASPAHIENSGFRLLRCAAIYGANASGKSNLVRALKFCERLVLSGTAVDAKIADKRFRLDPSSALAPSIFEYELLIEGMVYSYGFKVTPDAVVEEWLFRTAPGGDEELAFERSIDADSPNKTIFEFGPALSREQNRLQFLGFVGEGTRRNQLFLHEAIERNVVELEPVFSWFKHGLYTIQPNSVYFSLAQRINEEPTFQRFLESYLAGADTGITGLTTRKSEVELELLPSDMKVENQEEFERGLIKTLSRGERLLTKEEGKWVSLNLYAQHKDVTGNDVQFPIKDESDGTRRLMHLAPALQAVEGKARTLVIDELDRSLHPLLTRKFVLDFLIGAQQKQEQLIFTTHDTNLLARDLLPLEAVWFVEKNEVGRSSLYSLAEFNPEQLGQLDGTIEAGYLRGRFGAIPFFADRKRLGWNREGA